MNKDILPNLPMNEKEASELALRWNEPAPDGKGTRRDHALNILKTLCKAGSTPDPKRPKEFDLRGIKLEGEDLSGLNLSRYDFSGANLDSADMSGSNLSWACFESASLINARLDDCEFLGGVLSHAVFNECSGKRAGFGAANLSHASFISARLKDATLSKAKLGNSDFRAADLRGARITEADLTNAGFTRADMRGVDLKKSYVEGANFELADLRKARMISIGAFSKAKWIGADIRDMDLRGAYMARRWIRDENYLYEFRTRSKYHAALYWLWWATSDCGRSLIRWTGVVALTSILFAIVYSIVNIDFGEHHTIFSPLYFSIVTMTTLGYGDVIPTSIAAQIITTFQALLGYVGLGGLLSILANKMARRAD